MNEAILIFTFSPIQPFIAEARRPNDMYVGSRVLVMLSRAAGEVVREKLIYPTELTYDIPNRIVAKVSWKAGKETACKMEKALLDEWAAIAADAKKEFFKLWSAGAANQPVQSDPVWAAIWERQIQRDVFWEVYWSIAAIESTDQDTARAYSEAYQKADRILAAAKRMRKFKQAEEKGIKDTLSGIRTALHTAELDTKKYWSAVAGMTTASALKSAARETLDAFGVIKRFHPIAKSPTNPYSGFPSTSSIASIPFLEKVKQSKELQNYRKKLEALFNSDPDNKDRLFRVRGRDDSWSYDGDFFYPETLESANLAKEYHLEQPKKIALHEAQEALKALRSIAEPSPYYAILMLDGDSMGKKVNHCLDSSTPEEAHKAFSTKLSEFAAKAQEIVLYPGGIMVYNGGDDVFALAPIDSVLNIARQLSLVFGEITGELSVSYPGLGRGTVSAGIAIIHHRYPLGAALRAARAAEQEAKNADPDKDMLSIRLLKRSGAPLKVFGNWSVVNAHMPEMIHRFANQKGQSPEPFSSRLVYDLASLEHVFPEANQAFHSELRRQANRHKLDDQFDARSWADIFLYPWAQELPAPVEGNAVPSKPKNLVNWLLLARFFAKGGQE